MNPKQLATKVAKESTGVSVRHGRTNGEAVLHLVRKAPNAESRTIPATAAAWDLDPWNDASLYNRKSKEDS